MPGFSLWLVPPADSAIHATLSALIASSLPARFPADSPPKFVPHVTLTSDVPATAFSQSSASSDSSGGGGGGGGGEEERQKRDAQAWLDALPWPAARDVRVRFSALDVGEKFVTKLTLRVRKDEELEQEEGDGAGVRELASVARLHGVEGGERKDAVDAWLDQSYRPHCSLVYGAMSISDEKKAELQRVIEEAGIGIDGSGELGGWVGGSVWLVPTFLQIPEWTPWATRAL